MIPRFDTNYLRKYKDPVVDLFAKYIKEVLPDSNIVITESDAISDVRKYAIILPTTGPESTSLVRTTQRMLKRVSKAIIQGLDRTVSEIHIEVVVSENIKGEVEVFNTLKQEGYTILHVRFEGREPDGAMSSIYSQSKARLNFIADADITFIGSLSKSSCGDCYEAAGRYILKKGLRNPDLRLVHGEVLGRGDLQGVWFGHAWVEDIKKGIVLEVANGRLVKMPKEVYYALGTINIPYYENGKVHPPKNNIYVYDINQTRQKTIDFEHWGPWDLKTEF
jgi:hypothetical protein